MTTSQVWLIPKATVILVISALDSFIRNSQPEQNYRCVEELADLGSARLRAPSPIVFISMQFSAKIMPNNRLVLLLWGWRAPSGKSVK